METRTDRARRGAINGLIVGGVFHLIAWLAALSRGEPLTILLPLLIICAAVGAIIGALRHKKGLPPRGSSPS